MPDERFDDRLGGKALVHEKRQRGDVERQPLGLARPVEEWATQALQVIDRFLERANRGDDASVGRCLRMRSPNP